MNPSHIERFLADSAHYFGLAPVAPTIRPASRQPIWSRPSILVATAAALFSSLALALPTPRELAAAVVAHQPAPPVPERLARPSDSTNTPEGSGLAGRGHQAEAGTRLALLGCSSAPDAPCATAAAPSQSVSLRR